MSPSKTNSKQNETIARLEERLSGVEKSLNSLTGKISTFWNDLNHIQKDIASLNTGQKISYGLMTLILASLLALILK